MLPIKLIPTQENLGILSVGDNIQQMLRQHVEGVGVVEREDEQGSVGELVVGGGDGGNAFHAARVPELQLN